MAKIKLTKTELKAQTDALKRFQRFLPMLQLKKQQLQGEIAGIVAKADAVSARERDVRGRLSLAPTMASMTLAIGRFELLANWRACSSWFCMTSLPKSAMNLARPLELFTMM